MPGNSLLQLLKPLALPQCSQGGNSDTQNVPEPRECLGGLDQGGPAAQKALLKGKEMKEKSSEMGRRKQIFALQGPLPSSVLEVPPNPAASSCRMERVGSQQRQEQAVRPGLGCVKAGRGFLCCPLRRDLAAAPSTCSCTSLQPRRSWVS